MIDVYGEPVVEKAEEEQYKRKRVSLFDWLNDLNQDKKYLFNSNTETDFSTFMVNRGMSQNVDTIMIANELNKQYGVTREMAHDFYFYILPKKKRYGKWAKQNNDRKEDIDLLIKHYSVNRSIATLYLSMLTQEELEQIKQMNDVGGKRQ